jgi:hypothetical protein
VQLPDDRDTPAVYFEDVYGVVPLGFGWALRHRLAGRLEDGSII